MMKPKDAIAKAAPLLQRALELDNTMAEAHCTLGLLKSWYELDWAGAEREFQVALSLDSSHLTALLWQSLYLAAMGRYEESIASVKRARESEPLSPVMNMYLGVAQTHAGQYDLALRQLSRLSNSTHTFTGRTCFWVECMQVWSNTRMPSRRISGPSH
jgi:tetratricopeptide (TPR) repeat protein